MPPSFRFTHLALSTLMTAIAACGSDGAPSTGGPSTGGTSAVNPSTAGSGGGTTTGEGGDKAGGGGASGAISTDSDASIDASLEALDANSAKTDGATIAGRSTFENQKAFAELRYGMFIHFNMGTFVDQEWASPNYPPTRFAPKTVDTDQWAAAAKAGGMKFAVLTTKHHDGFALWPTKVSPYNVMNSAYKMDVVKQFVDSFRKAGVTPCLYFSIWDRTQGIEKGSVSKADLDFIVAQLTELLDGTYGQFPLIMFDGWTWQMGRNEVPYQLIRDTVRGLQPNILMVDHNGLTQAFEEDVLNFEHFSVPATNMLASTQGNPIMAKWFWHPGYDTASPLSVNTLLSRLGTTESHWCNFLLDCPPNPDGVLDKNVVDRLAEVGKQWKPNLARAPLPAQPLQLEHPVTPVAVTTSSNSAMAANAIDGMNDFVSGETVQSLWQSATGLPQSVTMDLGKVYQNLEYFGYMPRQDHVTVGAVTSAHVTTGNITAYNLYTSTDGTTFTKITSGTWPADGIIKRLQLPAFTARYVRLEATAVSGANYAVVSEVDTGGIAQQPTPMN